jgi:hypothetical protein
VPDVSRDALAVEPSARVLASVDRVAGADFRVSEVGCAPGRVAWEEDIWEQVAACTGQTDLEQLLATIFGVKTDE